MKICPGKWLRSPRLATFSIGQFWREVSIGVLKRTYEVRQILECGVKRRFGCATLQEDPAIDRQKKSQLTRTSGFCPELVDPLRHPRLAVVPACSASGSTKNPRNSTFSAFSGKFYTEKFALATRLTFLILTLSIQSIVAQVAVTPISQTGRPGFSLVPETTTGIRFTNVLDQGQALANANLLNGSGVALGDYDGDGLCDIYFCGLSNDNKLYKNLGNWKFQDLTAEAGVSCPNQNATGAVFADVNGDGKLDLIVSSMGGPNACFINQGNGRFVDTIATCGLTSRLGGMSMAFGDVDGTGTLDLYLANYGATSILRSGGALNVSYVNGKPVVRGRYAQRIKIIDGMMYELGEPDALYLNDGKGNFKQVSWIDGTFLDEAGKPLREAPWDQSLSVAFRDVNGDSAPDIYVCSDASTPDRFWINDGQGHFRAMDHLSWRSTSHFSMGVDFGDLNRDGFDDFFVVDMLSREHRYIVTQKGSMPPQPRAPGQIDYQMQMRRNTLFENRGDATYAEIANFAGVAGSEWSWSGVFLDVDLDGWEDILVSNGFPFNMDDMDVRNKIRSFGQQSVEQSRRNMMLFPPLVTPNLAFRNQRNMTFAETGADWGFNSTNVSNGFACADLDNDGDLDIVVNCLNTGALVYRNEADAPRIGVRVKGFAPNTGGVGAKITVFGGPVVQSQEIICGGRYVSGDDPMRVFACGSTNARMRIEVVWRNGTASVFENALPNHIYTLEESNAKPLQAKITEKHQPIFRDVSQSLGHRHIETEFNDFQIQPSLLNRLSQLGPGLAALDDFLFIGSSRGGQLAAFQNNNGRFETNNTNFRSPDDVTALVAWNPDPSTTQLLVGLNGWEGNGTSTLRQLNLSTSLPPVELPMAAAIGALALTELNGRMILFAGGRFVRGRYPEPAPSSLFYWDQNQWKLETVLEKVGSVTSAVWSDLNNDVVPELVLACEWGSLRVFQFESGKLVDRSAQWGLATLIGRWLSVATGDFNNDGRLDLIAGNWGENSFYNQAPNRQISLIYGDFENSGRIDMIEAYDNPASKKTVPWRDMESLSFAWLRAKFPSNAAYANASIADILSDKPNQRITTTTLSTTLLLNRGDHLESVPLPREAQYAPVFGIVVADFDGDGNEDLYLAQNFFDVRDRDSPLEAGRGLLLRGNGNGVFVPLSADDSGIRVYGEQRACATVDFNHDGRIDLVATQNGTETKLFENTTAKPGVRLRLKGSAPNLNAISAQLRIENGPTQELSAGSVIIAPPRRILVRWPNGKKTEYEIPPDCREVEIEPSGALRKIL